jgi:hypothetical protein
MKVKGLNGKVFMFQDLNVKVHFKPKWWKVHPAIDVVNGKAYVGVFLPCEVGKPPRNPNDFDEKTEKKFEEQFFLVSSDRELIYAHPPIGNNILMEHGLKLQCRPYKPKYPTWSPEHVERFLNGEKVDPKVVFDKILKVFNEFMEFEKPEYAKLYTIYTVATYFHQLFDTFPELFVTGTKRVGKTKLLLLFKFMAFNGVKSSSISEPSIFRFTDAYRPTLLMDETDKISTNRESEKRVLLLARYKRGDEAFRVEGETVRIPTGFDLYGPLIIANIQGLDDVLQDRAIPAILPRSVNPKVLDSYPKYSDPVWAEIRHQCFVLFLTFYDEVKKFSEGSEGSDGCEAEKGGTLLRGRERELWHPILTMAKFFEKHGVEGLTKQILDLAHEIVKFKETDDLTQNTDIALALTLPRIVEEESDDNFYYVKKIKEELVKTLERDKAPDWLTNEWVGRALTRLGFKQKRRLGTGVQYFILKTQVNDVLRRLGLTPLLASQPSQLTQPSLNQNGETLKTCWVCLKPLDLSCDKWIQNNFTNNLPVHFECYQKLKDGVKENGN